MAAYDDAVQELSRAPLADFVAERKRLAADLKKRRADGAAELAVRRKPPVSAWVVNQLWWQARDAFDAMLATAARLRKGQMDATRAHQDALAKLRDRAEQLLRDAGHGASDATLRRVTTTLAALAASGGFAPDPDGALEDDREAPGFEALGGLELAPASKADDEGTPRKHAARASGAAGSDEPDGAAERARERRLAAAERQRRRDEERAERVRERERQARARAERARLERALDAALREERTRERAVAQLEEEAKAARAALDEARAQTRAAERALAALEPEQPAASS